ncbi:MAG: Flp family type IVb pilin [Caulobacterales bacterium]|nr:Flp family type IVb pilin [Caulobacterales bacterium]
MDKFFSRFIKDESGATAIEYGLIAALVAIVLITALNGLSAQLSGTFTGIATDLNTETGYAPTE